MTAIKTDFRIERDALRGGAYPLVILAMRIDRSHIPQEIEAIAELLEMKMAGVAIVAIPTAAPIFIPMATATTVSVYINPCR